MWALEDDAWHPLLRGEVADKLVPHLAADGVPGDEGGDLGAEAQGMLVERLRDELLGLAVRRVEEDVPIACCQRDDPWFGAQTRRSGAEEGAEEGDRSIEKRSIEDRSIEDRSIKNRSIENRSTI